MKLNLFSALLLVFTLSVFGQEKITLDKIYSDVFSPKGMDEFRAMKKSNQYTALNIDAASGKQQIDLYDYATLKKVETIISTKDYADLPEIEGYEFDFSGRRILLTCNSSKIYRHSTSAIYYLFDRDTKELTRLFYSKVQETTFSPDGKKIAFVEENNIYIYDLDLKETTTLTTDGAKNKIINGLADWVYEEEFSFVRAFEWSPDGKKIAYIKFNETNVPEFSMAIYRGNLYPRTDTFKYPKAGEKNSEVSLHIYDVATKDTKKIDLSEYNDFYIPRIKWTTEANILSAQVLNRHQDKLDLLFVDASLGTKKVILTEKDNAYIEITNNLSFLKGNSFIWTSENDGFNHIYLYDKYGKLKSQITKGNWDVTNYYGFDEKTNAVYYQSTQEGSINRAVYKIGINDKKATRLSKQIGTNSASFSSNFDYYINTFSSATQPPIYTLNSTKTGELVKAMEENTELKNRLIGYDLPTKEFSIIKMANGEELNSWILKPKSMDKSKKYPVLMYQYSGPGSQEVSNKWNESNDYWFMMLAQEGYIVACVDGRGTGFKGAKFKKATQKALGKFETEDQIAAARVIGNYPFVDKLRMGIFGWSFGGFMSSNCLLRAPEVFKMAVAVAPVTNWRFYDTIYTERYMQTPQENPDGYNQYSPINNADKLKGKYLLIHGSGDDNVHLQHTMRMMEVLIQSNKQFDSQIYPDKDHGIYGGNTRIHLYDKMTRFIKENL